MAWMGTKKPRIISQAFADTEFFCLLWLCLTHLFLIVPLPAPRMAAGIILIVPL